MKQEQKNFIAYQINKGENKMSEFRTIELLNEIKELLTKKESTDKWMDINDASKYTTVSMATIRRNVKDNKLKASTRLGKLLFKRSELENWLNS